MIALIADIHGNLEALQEVLADIDKVGCESIYCIGDVVGYGPNPAECVDIVMQRCKIATLGNHDLGLVTMAFGFNRVAKPAIDWQRELMKPGVLSIQKRKRWNWLKSLVYSYEEGKVLYLHGSPLDPIMDYLRKADVEDLGFGVGEKAQKIFEKVKYICFISHSHQPAVITDDYNFIVPEELVDSKLELDRNRKYVINIGSVGQPRDRNNKACYLLFDGDNNIEYRRVEYDFEKTIAKIKKIDGIPDRAGERLRDGT